MNVTKAFLMKNKDSQTGLPHSYCPPARCAKWHNRLGSRYLCIVVCTCCLHCRFHFHLLSFSFRFHSSPMPCAPEILQLCASIAQWALHSTPISIPLSLVSLTCSYFDDVPLESRRRPHPHGLYYWLLNSYMCCESFFSATCRQTTKSGWVQQ